MFKNLYSLSSFIDTPFPPNPVLTDMLNSIPSNQVSVLKLNAQTAILPPIKNLLGSTISRTAPIMPNITNMIKPYGNNKNMLLS